MTNPRLSFSIAFLIWFFLIAAFSFSIFTKSQIQPLSLTIDAAMLEEVSQKKESAKIKKEIAADAATSDVQKKAAKKAVPLFSPLPKIPDDLRSEAFRSEAIARFHIASNGSVTNVELIKPCSNPRLNHLLLRSLRHWKFSPNSQNYSQEIRVNFEVK